MAYSFLPCMKNRSPLSLDVPRALVLSICPFCPHHVTAQHLQAVWKLKIRLEIKSFQHHLFGISEAHVIFIWKYIKIIYRTSCSFFLKGVSSAETVTRNYGLDLYVRRTINNQSEAKESQVSSPAGSVSSLKIGGVLLFY